MKPIFNIFLITWPTIIFYSTAIKAQCNSSSLIGYILAGHVYKNVSASDPLQCYSACKQEEPKCKSFNFHADERLCSLSNQWKESRPADIIPSKVAVYYHSCYRVRLGSTKASAANSCAEILKREDSLGNGWYWVRTTGNESVNIFCNMTSGGKTSSSFDFVFPTTRNITNYAMISTNLGSLSAFTVSLWLKTNQKILVPFSYAVQGQTNAILFYLDETDFFRFLVNGKQVGGEIGSLGDKAWHHVSATWVSKIGHAQVFIDGVLKLNKTNVALNTRINGEGKIVLGQDQDTVGGGFDTQQSFSGELAHVYFWNIALNADIIKNISRVCKEFPYPGHLIGWKDFDGSLHGDVVRRNLSRCRLYP